LINFKESLKDKINLYLNKLKKSGLADKSIETYKKLLNHFEIWFEDYGLISEDNLVLMEADIEKFIDYLKSKNLSPTTIKMVLNRAKEFVEFSGGKWYADKRIYRERSKTESARPFSELELKQILNHLKNTNLVYYYLTLTLYGFGLRVSEAVNLLPDDIIEKEGQIFVRVRPEVSKFSKSREAPLILKGQYRNDFIEFIIKRKNRQLFYIKSRKFRNL
jgi:integrase